MITQMTYPGGATSSAVIYNESVLPVAIQLTALKRNIDKRGLEKNEEEFDDISVYPPQIVVPPNSKKTFKIVYTGKPLTDKELSYRVLVEESPVDLNPIKIKGSGIKFKVRYMTAVYVTPKNASSDVTVKGISREKGKFILTLVNTGSKHQLLNNLKVTFKHKGLSVSLDKRELKGVTGENILSKSERSFVLDSASINKVNLESETSVSFDPN